MGVFTLPEIPKLEGKVAFPSRPVVTVVVPTFSGLGAPPSLQ